MKSIPSQFFATAAIFALIGMLWGIQMSASQDHSLSPAHRHLNLIGFVTMSLYAIYYALTPQAAGSRLAKIHYYLTLIMVLVMVPGIYLAIAEEQDMLAKLGSVPAVLSMALFLYMIFRFGVGVRKED